MTIAYLGLGSNLGDRFSNLQLAIDGLGDTDGVFVIAISAVYETNPVGGPQQPPYLNAAVAIETNLTARSLLEVAQRLEEAAGRVREERWGPRTLDVDVLIVGDEKVDAPDLVVPHQKMNERGFVLAPMADLPPVSVEIPLRRPAVSWPGVTRTHLTLRLPGGAPVQPDGGRR